MIGRKFANLVKVFPRHILHRGIKEIEPYIFGTPWTHVLCYDNTAWWLFDSGHLRQKEFPASRNFSLDFNWHNGTRF